MLKNKVAVIYGAGGGIGSAVARAFAREGARLFLTGRRQAPIEAVASEIISAGGFAQAAEVDALDEQALAKRSVRSASRMRRFWACLWSSWMLNSSRCRS
jgi:NADP-dependent 3-hydroxy acid dehydrogenase YdfG